MPRARAVAGQGRALLARLLLRPRRTTRGNGASSQELPAPESISTLDARRSTLDDSLHFLLRVVGDQHQPQHLELGLQRRVHRAELGLDDAPALRDVAVVL